jgi:hypothetical protein
MRDINFFINSKENTCESKHVNTYRQKIQDVPITQCFCCERLFIWNNLKLLQKNWHKKNTFSQIEMINHTITIHVCSNCLNNINKGKRPQYQMSYNISRNKMISSITKLTNLEECLISSWLVFAQIYNLHGYGQYKMKGGVINVATNINQT